MRFSPTVRVLAAFVFVGAVFGLFHMVIGLDSLGHYRPVLGHEMARDLTSMQRTLSILTQRFVSTRAELKMMRRALADVMTHTKDSAGDNSLLVNGFSEVQREIGSLRRRVRAVEAQLAAASASAEPTPSPVSMPTAPPTAVATAPPTAAAAVPPTAAATAVAPETAAPVSTSVLSGGRSCGPAQERLDLVGYAAKANPMLRGLSAAECQRRCETWGGNDYGNKTVKSHGVSIHLSELATASCVGWTLLRRQPQHDNECWLHETTDTVVSQSLDAAAAGSTTAAAAHVSGVCDGGITKPARCGPVVKGRDYPGYNKVWPVSLWPVSL